MLAASHPICPESSRLRLVMTSLEPKPRKVVRLLNCSRSLMSVLLKVQR